MKKKLLSLLLALCLVMALVPMTAFAEGTSVDNWDGSADTSWYTSAPDASAYHISTAEQLAGLAQLVNADPGTTNFAGKTFYLDNDLAGRVNARKIKALLKSDQRFSKIRVSVNPPRSGKDYNEKLQRTLQEIRVEKHASRQKQAAVSI